MQLPLTRLRRPRDRWTREEHAACTARGFAFAAQRTEEDDGAFWLYRLGGGRSPVHAIVFVHDYSAPRRLAVESLAAGMFGAPLTGDWIPWLANVAAIAYRRER